MNEIQANSNDLLNILMQLNQLQNEFTRLISERDKALETVNTHTRCAYCGEGFDKDSSITERLNKHIHECPQHPMRLVERERDEAQALLISLTDLLNSWMQEYTSKRCESPKYLGNMLTWWWNEMNTRLNDAYKHLNQVRNQEVITLLRFDRTHKLLTECVSAMQTWGQEEDGIPSDGPIGKAYDAACTWLLTLSLEEKTTTESQKCKTCNGTEHEGYQIR